MPTRRCLVGIFIGGEPMGHRRGESRQQAALFPVLLDELVGEHALARVVDAWVEALDLKALGFAKAQAQVMGAPPRMTRRTF